MNQRQQTEARLMVVLNIIQQLLNSRQKTLFSHQELTTTQFGLLNHFTHNPERSWMVTELAEVMENLIMDKENYLMPQQLWIGLKKEI